MASTENVQVPAQEGHRVYIGNLAYSTTEEQVREHLATVGGKPTTVVLPLKFGKRPGGYAFADFENEEDAKAIVAKLGGTELNGRQLRLDPARSKEESDSRRAAAREQRDAARAARDAEKAATGETTAVEAKTDGEATKAGGERKRRPSKKRISRRRQPGEEGEEGTAEVAEGADGAAAGDAKPKRAARKPKAPKEPKEARIDAAEGDAEATPEKPKGRQPRKPREKTMEPTGEPSKTTIFVANLPFDLDDAGLSAIFTNLSINIKSAKVATRLLPRPKNPEEPRGRRSKGFGFVEVEDPAQQKEAVEKVEGSLIGDRKISAKVANEMKPIEKEQVAEGAKEGAEVPAATV